MTSEFAHGRFYNDYTFDHLRILCDGKQCTAFIRATRYQSDWDAPAWVSSNILKVPDKYKSVIGDFNVPTTDWRIAYQINGNDIAIRPSSKVFIQHGMWFSGVLRWPIK